MGLAREATRLAEKHRDSRWDLLWTAKPAAMERLQRQAAALQELLGLEALPQDGREARDAARRLGQLVLGSVAPPPLLSQLLAEHLAAMPPVRSRFVDVSTGLRLRYLEWGSGRSDVVLLLHDLGESADVWRPLGPRLADRGYRVIALDLRGHGDSGRSLDGRYSAEALAEDVKAFIVALDLYVAPVALVGCGVGAAAALALAQSSAFLAGAVLAAEFALPAEVLAAAAAGVPAGNGSGSSSPSGSGCASAPPAAPSKPVRNAGGLVEVAASAAKPLPGQQQGRPGGSGSGGAGTLSSTTLLPWWGFRTGQASAFSSIEQCAAFLAHPLANLAPGILEPLSQAAQVAAAATDPPADEAAAIRPLLAALQRPLRGAVASACCLLRLPDEQAGRGGWGGWDTWEDEATELLPRMDPSFLFSFDAATLAAGMPSLRCHLQLLRGSGAGSWVASADADATAAAGSAAASASTVELNGGGHWLAADQPEALLRLAVAFLEGPAIRCFDRRQLPGGGGSSRVGSGHGRLPELLDLKPLPQYASLEEAQKALGPRTIPTAAVVEDELRKLRVEAGRPADDASSDEEEGEVGGRGGRRTALAQQPEEYFAFCG